MHECQLATWLTYKLGLVGYKNPFAKFGIVIHDILEEYARHCISNKFDTDYEELDRIKLKHFPNLEIDQLKDANAVVETIKNNFNWNADLQYPIVEIERRFALDENFEPFVPKNEEDEPYISGAIDKVVIDGDFAHASDYKTVRIIYTKSFMENSLQRKIYSLLILKYYPEVDTVGFSFNFARYGYISEEFIYTRDKIAELETEIRAEIIALQELLAQTEPPSASPGGFCILCENRASCEAYQNAFDITERIESIDDAIKLFQKFSLAKIKIKAVETMLKQWINANGPICIKNMEYGPQPYETIEFTDIKKLTEILKEAEVPEGAIFDALGTNKTNVGKIVKKFKLSPEVQKKIEKVTNKGKITKFVVKKIEEMTSEEDETSEGYVDPFI